MRIQWWDRAVWRSSPVLGSPLCLPFRTFLQCQRVPVRAVYISDSSISCRTETCRIKRGVLIRVAWPETVGTGTPFPRLNVVAGATDASRAMLLTSCCKAELLTAIFGFL